MSNIAQRLKELRKEKALTQREFAAIFNVNHSTLAMWETSKNQPDIETLKKLASFFQTTIDDLVGNSDEWGNTTSPAHTVSALSTDEQLLLSAYKNLTPGQKKGLFQMLEIDQTQQIKKGS